jgi:hypothetical protein
VGIQTIEEMTGRVFGRWTVLGRDLERKSRFTYWICRCSCPAQPVKSIQGTALRTGSSLSCGCYRAERVSEAKTRHGMNKTPLHNAWMAMIQRCEDTNYWAYAAYGGRGIKVCERWRGSEGFAQFLADMGERPAGNYSIDRIDNDGDYRPDNCRWATKKEQARNRRNTLFITLEGKTRTVTDWVQSGRSPRQLLWVVCEENQQLRDEIDRLKAGLPEV